jgi:hypothetical protein
MAKSTKKVKRPTTKPHRLGRRFATQPSPRELISKPDITATARLRFDCALYIKVTHAEYTPQEVVALIKQGQVPLDPIAPGQVGSLILDGIPYTLLGYYTFADQGGEFEDGPKEVAFHGDWPESSR